MPSHDMFSFATFGYITFYDDVKVLIASEPDIRLASSSMKKKKSIVVFIVVDGR